MGLVTWFVDVIREVSDMVILSSEIPQDCKVGIMWSGTASFRLKKTFYIEVFNKYGIVPYQLFFPKMLGNNGLKVWVKTPSGLIGFSPTAHSVYKFSKTACNPIYKKYLYLRTDTKSF